jgi:transcription elongation factor Elf1
MPPSQKRVSTAVPDMQCLVCNFILLRPNIKSLGVVKSAKSGLDVETIEANCGNCGSEFRVSVEQTKSPITEYRIRDIDRKSEPERRH